MDRWITDLRVALCLLLRGYRLRPARQGVRKCRPSQSVAKLATPLAVAPSFRRGW